MCCAPTAAAVLAEQGLISWGNSDNGALGHDGDEESLQPLYPGFQTEPTLWDNSTFALTDKGTVYDIHSRSFQ